ncbi:MAG: hypothetical protein AB8B65_12805 [Kordia sp.]|uniref:hypothetical protein n=1 Tax=Kordia sp. TaxID=1965332 RepID=UPI00385FBCFF
MNNSDTFLLESKLKRLKISFSKKNGKIIIWQAKLDYTILIGLILFPLLVAIAGIVFLFVEDIGLDASARKKIIGVIIFVGAIAMTNCFRMFLKFKSNKATKVLGYKEIIIKNKDTSIRFDAATIDKFTFTINEVSEENYRGSLFLVDTKAQEHLLLGFDSESEQYIIDDLKWFSNYFEQHVQLNS